MLKRFLIFLLLLYVTLYYGFYILMGALLVATQYASSSGFLFSDFTLFGLAPLFGVLGLVGLWELFLIDHYKKRRDKIIVTIFIALGVIAAIYVAMIMFFSGLTPRSFVQFMLTWGFLILSGISVYALYRRVFRKK